MAKPGISRGVAKMESMSEHLTWSYRIAIFVSVFFVGLSYGLAASVINVYQSYATASYQSHSLLATANTLRTVFAVAAQPAAAKLADVIGRLEITYLSATFYVVGLIIQASSNDLPTFITGAVLNQVGLATTQIMVGVIMADLSSTRSRLFFYTLPNIHFIVTIWISGNISASMLVHSTWRWGIGMWAIVYVACLVPFVTSMMLAQRHAFRHGAPAVKIDLGVALREFFWKIDAPGLVLLIAVLALILTPLSLAGGVSEKWNSAGIIAPIVIGFLCIPAFVFWELRAPHPMIPFQRLRERSVWGALGVAVFFNFAVSMQAGYLYTVLIVAFDLSVTVATRVSTVYGFMAFVVGPLSGLAVYRVRHLRPFILSGVVVFTVAFGLLVRYRGGGDTSEQAGLVAGQVLLGLGAGLSGYTAGVALQVSAKHEHLAVLIALYMAAHNIGGGFGSSVSGSIWNQVLPSTLVSKLGDAALAMEVLADPFTEAAKYPVGTATRAAIIESYQHVQRLLCATGLGLCVPLAIFALVIPNFELTDEQTLAKDGSPSPSLHDPEADKE